jgi:hypothetical protein
MFLALILLFFILTILILSILYIFIIPCSCHSSAIRVIAAILCSLTSFCPSKSCLSINAHSLESAILALYLALWSIAPLFCSNCPASSSQCSLAPVWFRARPRSSPPRCGFRNCLFFRITSSVIVLTLGLSPQESCISFINFDTWHRAFHILYFFT